ncbi:MAG: hypothetical protein LBN07_01475 [Christensenellaceae bacterium]|nr:hypothetical protein [Christensenellaceae bacterium]
MKANIALVCALEDFNKEVGGKLAGKLDFYFMDVEDYLQFNMIDPEEVIEKCGVDYLNELRAKTITEVAAYYDTVISVNLDLAMQDEHLKCLKNRCFMVYLAVGEAALRKLATKEKDEKKKLEIETGLLAFGARDLRAKKDCDVVIDAGKMDIKSMLKKIEKEVGKKLIAAN